MLLRSLFAVIIAFYCDKINSKLSCSNHFFMEYLPIANMIANVTHFICARTQRGRCR